MYTKIFKNKYNQIKNRMKKVLLSAAVAVAAMVLASCGGSQSETLIVKGSASKFDSLSYALGANIAFDVTSQMSDMPFDYQQIKEGFEHGAFGKGDMSAEEALSELQNYFMSVRPERMQIVAQRRAEADSLAIAGGKTAEQVAADNANLKADADMFVDEAQRELISYAFGLNLGDNISKAELPIHVYWFNEAVQDVLDSAAKMTNEEAVAFLQNFFTVVRPAQMKALSKEKLAEVAKKSGVIKTESGLLYRIEDAGDMTIKANDDRDVVKVNYTGRLMRNGNVFDTSRFADRTEEQKAALEAQGAEGWDQDQPIEFPLNGVIEGWTEGMKFVGKGGKITLWIPADLAYGESARGQIQANDALEFYVEVVDVTPFEAPAE